MKVYRVQTRRQRVGGIIGNSPNNGRKDSLRWIVEKFLDENIPTDIKNSRMNSIFVFNGYSIVEQSVHWMSIKTSCQSTVCQCYLLELEVSDNDVEWHDSKYYEDLCFLIKKNCSCSVSNLGTKKELANNIGNVLLIREKLR